MRPTAKSLITAWLVEQGDSAVHDILIHGCSQTAISARLREMAREGIVIGERMNGKPYKTWRLIQS